MRKLITLITLVAISCNPESGVHKDKEMPWNNHFNNNWTDNKLWDDGLAEVNIYDAQRVIYGEPRNYEQVYVAVKETFNKEYQVKTDNYQRDDLFEVIKVNLFSDIPTHRYPYHFLMSIFFKRQSPDAVYKLNVSSQEWCGTTFKSMRKKSYGYDENYNSYWDGEGRGERQIEQVCLIEDQLVFSLRALKFEDGLNFSAPVMKSRMTSKATDPVIENSDFTVTDTAEAWSVKVEGAHIGKINYLFEKDYPNKMISMESSDGRIWKLKSSERDDYWLD
ncbi:hypothetical protein OO013_14660 [Mangrovivirga sp. M17]|uniref:Lipoprotein n=1 Tax=Mangrovivirga halotolerans TaxID=2993936 RepID=A0ABT3RUU4_9BACT|nr:hypothetical protein [Mangrovivirga halotolerans]MCX2745119.1 hypothetical protein [Mangrovivirga halotolerans]